MLLRLLMERCLSDLLIQGYAPVTLRELRINLNLFIAGLEAYGVQEIEGIQAEHLINYQESLAWKTTKREGRLLNPTYRNRILSAIRLFLQWLYKNDWIARDLSPKILFAKEPQKLPRNIPTEEEVIKVLETPDITTHSGYRDRLMMELLYVTGLRRNELAHIKLGDLELNQGCLYVRKGKGAKDRVVPLGRGVCELLRRYLDFVRPRFMEHHTRPHDFLFPGRKSEALCPSQMNTRIQHYGQQAGLAKRITAHSFRHACATHMMKHGAPIRHVQELLGHARINTTQIYMHVTINDLKKAHAKYHPREKMKLKNEPPSDGK